MEWITFITVVLLGAVLFGLQDLLRKMRAISKTLDEWRYEWGQRTPHNTSNAEIMSEIYGDGHKRK